MRDRGPLGPRQICMRPKHQRLRWVTLPKISPVILFAVVLVDIASLPWAGTP